MRWELFSQKLSGVPCGKFWNESVYGGLHINLNCSSRDIGASGPEISLLFIPNMLDINARGS